MSSLVFVSLNQQELRSLQIPFYLLHGSAKEQIPLFVTDHNVSVMVCDMSPLRLPIQWCKDVATELKKIKLPIVQVRNCILFILCRLILCNAVGAKY